MYVPGSTGYTRVFSPIPGLKPNGARARVCAYVRRVAHGFINGRVAFRGFKCIFQFTQCGRAASFRWRRLENRSMLKTIGGPPQWIEIDAQHSSKSDCAASCGHDRSIRFISVIQVEFAKCSPFRIHVRRWDEFDIVFRYTSVYTATTGECLL